MKASQLKEFVIEPVLEALGLKSGLATKMLLGTACMESNCGEYISQYPKGPAKGIYQMETATAKDIINNYLAYKKPLKEKVFSFYMNGYDLDFNLRTNMAFATAMARCHYLRQPGAIPDTLEGQAKYWKKYYNTEGGAGHPEEYIQKWKKHVGEF